LASLLFLVHINDFFYLDLRGQLKLYAENVVIMYSNKDLSQIYDDMEQDLRKLNDWFYHNQLTVNPNKTSYMIFRNPHKVIAYTRDILFGGQPIDLSIKTKYLDVPIDCNLNWVAQTHINSVRSNICSYIRVLRRIRYSVPVKTRLAVYYAHVHSRLCYLNVIWGSASVTKITELGRQQDKAI
jgi:hypothetical protein